MTTTTTMGTTNGSAVVQELGARPGGAPWYLERDGAVPFREVDEARRRIKEQEIVNRLEALAGAHGEEAMTLLVALQDLGTHQAEVEVADVFEQVGELIIRYSPHGHALWKALFVRLAVDPLSNVPPRHGTEMEGYRAGDELRWLWGKEWRWHATRLGVPIPADAPESGAADD